jgi:hypothetical protein
MFRNEIKYLIPIELLPKLKNLMKPYIRLDKFAGPPENPDYTVRSIYFDTKDLRYYREKNEGIKKRIKVRIRGYNQPSPDSIVFLELKRKKDNLIFKNRYPCYYKNLDRILNQEIVKEDVPLKQKDSNREKFLYNLLSLSLKPTVLVIYEREAYHYRFNSDLRITLDKNIRSVKPQNIHSLYSEEFTVPTFRNHFVLEVKSGSPFPGWILSIIKQMHLQKRSVSKYALSIDSQFKSSPRNMKFGYRNHITNIV